LERPSLALRSLNELRTSPKAPARGFPKRAVLTGSNAAAEAIVSEEHRSEDGVEVGRGASGEITDDDNVDDQAVAANISRIQLIK
jgi:hypothetical protein